MKYFELFGIETQFSVDLAHINQRYLELQRAVHPDRHAHSGAQEQLLAVQKTAELNDAFQILKDPLKRAEYILAERGLDIRAEQQTLKDPVFLMQQMELREELEDIPHANNVEAAIAQFEAHTKTLKNEYLAQLIAVIDSVEQEQLLQAADIIRKLKFIVKLQSELERIEDSLFED
jgi:molecular chaperone HscB